MSRIITFSQYFPAYHPKAGQPTYFVEKFYNSLYARNNLMDYPKGLEINESILEMKNHTIRAGSRWKKGDYFSPRVWSGRPYFTPQIILAPDTLITEVYDFSIQPAYKMLPLDYDTDITVNHNYYHTDDKIMKVVAQNDGLSLVELLQWFKYPKPFSGQIICWNENAKY